MLERVHVLTCTVQERNKKVGACLILEGEGGVFDHSAIYMCVCVCVRVGGIYIYIYIYIYIKGRGV